MSEELPMILDLGTDIANAEAPELLPVGEYPAEVRKVEAKVSAAGNHYIAVQFYIKPDDYPVDFDVAEAPDGTIITFSRVPYPEAGDKRGIYKMRKFMEALNVKPEGSKVDLDAWVGKTAIVGIKHTMYEGETRLECGKVSRDV